VVLSSPSFEAFEPLFPIGGLGGFSGGLVQLDDALEGFFEARFVLGWKLFGPAAEPLVTGQQERLGFGELLLPQQAGAEEAARVERGPVTVKVPLMRLPCFHPVLLYCPAERKAREIICKALYDILINPFTFS
jgi:hypothetical protein